MKGKLVMQTASEVVPRDICPLFEIGSPGVLLERVPNSRVALMSSDLQLITELVRIIDAQMLAVLESRTAEEFITARSRGWQRYARAVRALSDTVANIVSRELLAPIGELAMADFRADLEKQRGLVFDDALVDQVIFTIWVMSRIGHTTRKIIEAGEPHDKNQDALLNANFHAYLVWTQFHMDSVAITMKFRKSLSKEIQVLIVEGLRAAVNVYATAKQALRLRRAPFQAYLGVALPWDEEDEALLTSSMRDIDAISHSEG